MQYKSDIDVELIQSTGSDNVIVAAARVSTLGIHSKVEDTEAYGLINYLIKHRHGTPFEHNSMTFRVHAPIFVWREFHRHRIGFSFNEESGRYKQLEPIFWIPRPERPILPAADHKSARPHFVQGDDRDYAFITTQLKASYIISYENYLRMLNGGYAKEVCRACLPVAIYSACYVTCNARSLMHFLSLRTHEPTAKYVSYPQAEIEEVARKCEAIFAELFPLTYKAFVENGRVAP